MSSALYFQGSALDAGDLELGERLAVAVVAAVALAAPDLEHDQLLVTALRDDFGADLRARDERLAHCDLLAAEHQHFRKLELVTGAAGQLLYTQAAAFAHAILLATRLDDRVHVLIPSPARSGRGWKCTDRSRDCN